MVKIDAIDRGDTSGQSGQSDTLENVINKAIKDESIELLQLLKQQDPDIDGSKYLQAASSHGSIKCVKIFAEWQTQSPGPALREAARHGHFAIVEFLMTHLKNFSRQDILDAASCALDNRHTYAFQIIDQHKNSSLAKSSDAFTRDFWDECENNLVQPPFQNLFEANSQDEGGKKELSSKPLDSFQTSALGIQPSAPTLDKDDLWGSDQNDALKIGHLLTSPSKTASLNQAPDHAPSAPPLSPKRSDPQASTKPDIPPINPAALPLISEQPPTDSGSNSKKESEEVGDQNQNNLDTQVLKQLIKECLIEHKSESGLSQSIRDLIQISQCLTVQTPTYASSLHEAATNGDIDSIRYFIQQRKIPVDSYDENGKTALMHAIHQKHISAAKTLINLGANVNAQSKSRSTNVLFYSLFSHSEECFQLLIDQGADIHIKNHSGFTALMIAAQEFRLKEAEILLKRGLKIDEKNHNGRTALHHAAAIGKPEMIVWLVKHGANPRLKCLAGYTPVKHMVMNGKAKVIETLVQKGLIQYVPAKFYPASRPPVKIGEDFQHIVPKQAGQRHVYVMDLEFDCGYKHLYQIAAHNHKIAAYQVAGVAELVKKLDEQNRVIDLESYGEMHFHFEEKNGRLHIKVKEWNEAETGLVTIGNFSVDYHAVLVEAVFSLCTIVKPE